jgi:phosphatidylinositol alpha 1,6-mannosyltransferase
MGFPVRSRYKVECCIGKFMEGLRVALFTGNYNHIRDGVSQTLNRLVRFLESRGVEVLIFAPSIKHPQVDHDGELVVVPSVAIPGRSEYRFSLLLPKKEKQALEAFNPDIVHVATPDLLGILAVRWAREHGVCLVSSYHTHFTSYLTYYRLQWAESLVWRYLRWFYSKTRQIHAPTPSMVDKLKEVGFDGDLRVWSRGIDMDRFRPEKRSLEWRRSIGIEDDDIVVLFVSRLVWEKNVGLYTGALQQLMKKHDRVRPLVVGDGPAREDMEKKLPSESFTGYLYGDELARAYASSDLFLFPSVSEAFGNVTLEAMASGLPCVVANAVGSKSLVAHDVNGYLVDVNRPELFSEFADKLIVDTELRQRMAGSSLKRAASYSWSRINGQLLEAYREALTAHKGEV